MLSIIFTMLQSHIGKKKIPRIYSSKEYKVFLLQDKATSHVVNLTTQCLDNLMSRGSLTYVRKKISPKYH